MLRPRSMPVVFESATARSSAPYPKRPACDSSSVLRDIVDTTTPADRFCHRRQSRAYVDHGAFLPFRLTRGALEAERLSDTLNRGARIRRVEVLDPVDRKVLFAWHFISNAAAVGRPSRPTAVGLQYREKSCSSGSGTRRIRAVHGGNECPHGVRRARSFGSPPLTRSRGPAPPAAETPANWIIPSGRNFMARTPRSAETHSARSRPSGPSPISGSTSRRWSMRYQSAQLASGTRARWLADPERRPSSSRRDVPDRDRQRRDSPRATGPRRSRLDTVPRGHVPELGPGFGR